MKWKILKSLFFFLKKKKSKNPFHPKIRCLNIWSEVDLAKNFSPLPSCMGYTFRINTCCHIKDLKNS